MSAQQMDLVRSTLLRAIQIEARNAEIYVNFARLFSGYEDHVAAIFREMAAEERQHGVELEQRFQERFGPVSIDVEETKEVIEAPDLEDAEALIFDSMTVEQALEAGLKAEKIAQEFYGREKDRIDDPALQALYRELSEFEEDHVRRLQEKLEERLTEKRRAGSSRET